MRNCVLALAFVVAGGIIASQAMAGDPGYCDHCGCSCCRVVCRLVCDTRLVTDHCYDCVCEDFCIPGPSKRCNCNCECVHIPGPDVPPPCGCDVCCDNGTACKLKWYDWIPGCAKVHKRKILIKYEVVKEVPAYHWVTECVCDDCGHTEHLDTRPALPPPPPEPGDVVPTSAEMPVRPLPTLTPAPAPKPRTTSLLHQLLGN